MAGQLQHIYTYNKPLANLFQISVVRQVTSESPFQRHVFCFLSAIPGENTQAGGRTFNFQNKITMKVDYEKILSLANAIEAYATGKEAAFGPFTIYVDSSKSQFTSSSGGKSMGMQRGADKHGNPVVNLFFKTQTSQAIAISLSIADALSVAGVCKKIFARCFDLDFDISAQTSQTGTFPNQAMTQQTTVPPSRPPAAAPRTGATAPKPLINQPNTIENVSGNFASGLENFFTVDDDTPF